MSLEAPPRRTAPRRAPRRAVGRRRGRDPSREWARRLRRSRAGLVEDVLVALTRAYDVRPWRRGLDPTSELVLTILSQNSADVNAEHAFESLRARFPGRPPEDVTLRSPAGSPDDEDGVVGRATRPGWGGEGVYVAAAPDWLAVETAPLADLVEAIRPGGLAQQKAPRIQAALRHLRAERGDHSLEFLGGLDPLEARAWLTSIAGVGNKTASVVLLFSFGMPLMPVDRHVERVSKRVGLLPPRVSADEAHGHFLALLEPEQAYPMHVALITHGRRLCHARLPRCAACPIAARCRFLDRRAP